MVTLNPYLNYPGNAEEAFTHYKKVFGGEYNIVRFKDAPSEETVTGAEKEKAMHIALPIGKGNVLMMHGFMGQAAQIRRDNGAKEILKSNPGLKLLAEQTGEWDRAKGMSLTENWIQSYGDKINAIFAQNDEMGMGAVKALEAAGLKGKVLVVRVDAIPDALQAVKKGTLDATVFQNAKEQGGKAIETAVKAAKKEAFEKEVLIPFQLVTKENVGMFLK